MTPERIAALARATLSHGLIQLAIHFPDELEHLGLDPPQALERALGLAEEAITLAPELPDGHTALGRLLLCHDDAAAVRDAIEVMRHALSLDAEHDPAEIGLATALHAEGDSEAALQHVDRVIRRGNGNPQPKLLRALIHLDLGNTVEARRELEKAVHLAPEAGLLALDAARAARMDGDVEASEALRQRSESLLGRAFELVAESLEP